MTILKKIREERNLTQEELSQKSGISIRTIQRIEAGSEPKGQTRKILSKALGIPEADLLAKENKPDESKPTFPKLLNLSSLPFTFIPLANIAVPLLLMSAKKQFSPLAKQIVSIQIMWTIVAFILFMLAAFMKNWFTLGNKFMLLVMVALVLSNVFIILRNAAELDKKGKLYFKLNFNII